MNTEIYFGIFIAISAAIVLLFDVSATFKTVFGLILLLMIGVRYTFVTSKARAMVE